MSRKQFAINTAASTLNLLIHFSVNFFLTAYLVRTLGATAYGFFTLACTIVNYATIISNALNSMSARFVGKEYFRNNVYDAIKYYSSVLYGDLFFVLVISIPACLIFLNIDGFIDIPPNLVRDVRWLFFLVFANLCISICGSVFSVAFVIKNRLDISSIINVASTAFRALILLALYGTLRPSLLYLGYASLAAGIFVLIVNYFSNRRLLPELQARFSSVRLNAIREIAFSGMWNSFNQISIILLHGLDLLICNQMVSPLAMGYLSVAGTLPNAVTTCVSSFGYLFTPQLLEQYSKKEFESLASSISNSIKFMTVISVIPICFLIGFGRQFYALWTPDTDTSTVFFLSAGLILPNFTGAAINSMNYLYTVANKVKLPSIVLAITGVLNVTIIFILLKTTSLGVFGIVLTSALLGLIRNIVFNAPYAAKCIHRPYYIFWKEMFVSFGLTTAMCIICYIISETYSINSWIELILIGGASSLFCGLLTAFVILNKDQRLFLISKIFKR